MSNLTQLCEHYDYALKHEWHRTVIDYIATLIRKETESMRMMKELQNNYRGVNEQ
jgi:hypothetical protein